MKMVLTQAEIHEEAKRRSKQTPRYVSVLLSLGGDIGRVILKVSPRIFFDDDFNFDYVSHTGKSSNEIIEMYEEKCVDGMFMFLFITSVVYNPKQKLLSCHIGDEYVFVTSFFTKPHSNFDFLTDCFINISLDDQSCEFYI